MRLTSAGYLGIGTTEPTQYLDISRSNIGGFTAALIRNLDITNNSSASGIAFCPTIANWGASIFTDRGRGISGAIGGLNFATGSAGKALDVANIRMTILSTGYVGIGTTAPTAKLQCEGADFPVLATIRTITTTNTHNSGAVMVTRTSGDAADGIGGSFLFAIQDTNIPAKNFTAGLLGGIGATRYGADNSGRLELRTYNAGTADIKMAILPAGQVGIGTATPLATTNMLLDISKTSTGSTQVNANVYPILCITADATDNHIQGMQLQNKGTGTAAEMRFICAADTGTYMAFTQPGSGNTGNFMGITKSTGSFIFNSSNLTEEYRSLNFLTIDAADLNFGTANTLRMRILSTGQIGMGVAAPTAVLHLAAGTATASTAPLKFTTGTLLSSPEAGAVEFDTDKYYATITTGTARKEVQLYDTYYGEMYIYDNSTAETVDTNAVYKAVRNFSTGAVAGFTFSAGSTGPIASVADYSGTVAGTVLITDVGHGLVTGNVVTILGTTDYNGTFVVTRVDNDTFYITETYTSSQTGNWYKPSSLTANTGSAGTYRLSFNTTADSAAPGETYKCEANKNTTALDNIAIERNYATGTDYGVSAASGLVTVADGDVLWFSFKQTSAGTDSLTIRHANFNINRI
jgi:hypothetical protein